MTTLSNARASTLWIMLLTLASAVTTLALGCATPFTALAALAATQMHARDGVLLMIVVWAASQIVGFCVLDYPRDVSTMLWGVALGMAAVTSVVVARRINAHNTLVRITLAYLVATVAFKLVILLCSLGLGGVDIALSPSINARQFVRNAAILVGLYALYRGLILAGLPAAPHGRTATA